MARQGAMHLTFGVPYMAKYGIRANEWRLSVVVVVMPAVAPGRVLVSRWSVKGRKWSQPQPLIGGICRMATELDCRAKGVPAPSDAYWRQVREELKQIHAAIGIASDGVDVFWGLVHTFNFEG